MIKPNWVLKVQFEIFYSPLLKLLILCTNNDLLNLGFWMARDKIFNILLCFQNADKQNVRGLIGVY
ncbi:MAG: hypothetical protein EA409_08605 [Saprospirales bacterium]|nr:MAG: hypothetical protein EA409_08605 [Saprospirales bacterium]